MCQHKMQVTASLTQNSFASFSAQNPHRQLDGYQNSTTNWRINTGFKKLQKRINERHKSGKSVIKNRSLPPISGDATARRDKHSVRDKLKDNPDKITEHKTGEPVTSRTLTKAKRDGPSEFSVSLQYELYRTSNNGLNRISARMKKNRFRRPSQTSLDFSDSSSFFNEEDMCSIQRQATPQLPVIDKAKLLKHEVQKMDKEHEQYFEEELENRIVKWIKQCKMYDSYDGSPYEDLDTKLRKKLRQGHTSPRHKTDGVSHLERSNTCL